ncbi:hypothetical protein TVAG_255720 [Trichomonas vaginalis G3]|uniref:Uncharacterized protein n=1 Tax=Trichomonas vaginalis (strain ATCC PRA-98 / G3) TaxID=412133 RepID=A2DYW9_TRIV3|nr:armadillo (ARM) repeat-containing protein family [Trichomonas vaginalis G3]EAY14380.1 hypothetical protein TVAG_255720 [Trichomonas vaginalis G3]KAI5501261.1 armadillo (ARM) repeat-containing protein family [Trichomonas vaginalis G3]|eukprot:XP_001326603.1 hypothetical protein [Trichomonas vaginalis G3]
MTQECPSLELIQFMLNQMSPDNAISVSINGIKENSEPPGVIFLYLNKIYQFMDKQKPEDVVFLCLKAASNFHPKIHRRSATILSKLFESSPQLLSKFSEQISKHKNLDFLQYLVSKIIKTLPSLRGLKNLVRKTTERTINEIDVSTVPIYMQKSTIDFMASCVNGNFLEYTDSLTIFKKILDFSPEVNYNLFKVIHIFYPYFFNEVSITDKIIQRVGNNMNVMIILVRLEYDIYMYNSAIEKFPSSKFPENFPRPRLVAGKFAKEIIKTLLDELFFIRDPRYQAYQSISLDIFKVSGVNPGDVIPLIAEQYSMLMDDDKNLTTIQAIMLLTSVGSHRFNTDPETEKGIQEFCKLALDDLLLSMKDGKKRNIMTASYVALCYVLRSYGTSTMWNHIIRHIADEVDFPRVDTFRAQLIYEAIEKFHCKCFNRQAVNFIMQKIHSKRGHSDERQLLASEIEAIVTSGDINTSKILELIHYHCISSASPWLHSLSASILSQGDPSKLIGKTTSNFNVFFPHSNVPLISAFRLMCGLMPSINKMQFDTLTSKRALSDVLTSAYEGNFFWAVRFILFTLRRFGDQVISHIPGLCNEIDNMAFRKEAFVPLCITPLAVAIQFLYPKVPEVGRKGDIAIRRYEERYDKGWTCEPDKINYHLVALTELILCGAKRSDGTTFEDSVDQICQSLFWTVELQNTTIDYAVGMIDAVFVKGLKLSKPMMLVLALAHSKQEFKKHIDDVYGKILFE